MNFEFMTIDTPLPPCMPFALLLTYVAENL